MEIRGIKYVGPFFDSSGYAQAARSYVLALHKIGIPITLAPVAFEKDGPDLGKNGEILMSLINKDIDYNIVITELTPEFWAQKFEPGKFNIGYTVWETSRLHPSWPGWINQADAVMCSCQWNVDVFKDSGVTKPVYCVPHGIDIDEIDALSVSEIQGVKPDAYKFYSIFQFTERKNPMALIKSYWHAFPNKENVALILQTYRSNFSDSEKEAIRSTIKKLKEVSPADWYPPLYLLLDMPSRKDIFGLHKFGDCFINLNRGEGFGLTSFEAGACGKPVITTGMGGVLEYLNDDRGYTVNYTWAPVSGMPWSPWYRVDQMWAEPDCLDAINKMKHVYNNRQEAAEKGIKLREFISTELSIEAVGRKMIDVIKSI